MTLFNPVPALADQHGPRNIPYTIKYIHPHLKSYLRTSARRFPNCTQTHHLTSAALCVNYPYAITFLHCKKEKRKHIKVVVAAWDRNLWGCLLPLKEKSLTAHAQTFPNIHIIFNLSGQLARRKWSWGIYFH